MFSMRRKINGYGVEDLARAGRVIKAVQSILSAQPEWQSPFARVSLHAAIERCVMSFIRAGEANEEILTAGVLRTMRFDLQSPAVLRWRRGDIDVERRYGSLRDAVQAAMRDLSPSWATRSLRSFRPARLQPPSTQASEPSSPYGTPWNPVSIGFLAVVPPPRTSAAAPTTPTRQKHPA